MGKDNIYVTWRATDEASAFHCLNSWVCYRACSGALRTESVRSASGTRTVMPGRSRAHAPRLDWGQQKTVQRRPVHCRGRPHSNASFHAFRRAQRRSVHCRGPLFFVDVAVRSQTCAATGLVLCFAGPRLGMGHARRAVLRTYQRLWAMYIILEASRSLQLLGRNASCLTAQRRNEAFAFHSLSSWACYRACSGALRTESVRSASRAHAPRLDLGQQKNSTA